MFRGALKSETGENLIGNGFILSEVAAATGWFDRLTMLSEVEASKDLFRRPARRHTTGVRLMYVGSFGRRGDLRMTTWRYFVTLNVVSVRSFLETLIGRRILVYADFIDPFCYLGIHTLTPLANARRIILEWRGFELSAYLDRPVFGVIPAKARTPHTRRARPVVWRAGI